MNNQELEYMAPPKSFPTAATNISNVYLDRGATRPEDLFDDIHLSFVVQ